MCCNGNSEGELKIGEEAIATVTEFWYLGSTVESAGVDSEVNRGYKLDGTTGER